MHMAYNPGRAWRRLSLARQFVLASALILLAGMFVMGFWVTGKIQSGITQNTASATALYMDSFITPLVQELAEADELSPATLKALRNLFANQRPDHRIVSLKIWKNGGKVVFSNHPSIIGRVFPITPKLRRAWSGGVAAEFDDLADAEDAPERVSGLPLLELFSPIRDAKSGRIIAVAEFYEDATKLKRELLYTKLQSWLFVATVTLIILGLLSGIVRRGSQTIERQRRVLEGRVEQLSGLLDQNEILRARARQSSLRSTEINEHFLRRISADLHDGPAQLLGLVLLRLDSLGPLLAQPEAEEAVPAQALETIRRALNEALDEIRNLSAGLALPELEHLTLGECLEKAVQRHERRTKTKVRSKFSDLPEKVTMPYKISAYRFIQEALANAYLHGGAKDQTVLASYDGAGLEIEVSDKGPGFDPASQATEDGLGLLGLRERIESLGGIFEIQSTINAGTRVKSRIPLDNLRE